MATFWIVVGQGNSDTIGKNLSSQARANLQPGVPVANFAVPSGHDAPKFGSFDDLIRLTDDLQKHDTATEGVLRRIERQWVDINENAEFMVNGTQTVGQYLSDGWSWDEKKYPTSRTLQGSLDFLLDIVQKLDEQCRNRGQNHSDIKGKATAVVKRDAVTFPTRDLIDLLVPGVVDAAEFVERPHLTTVIVILARGQEKDFLDWYEQPRYESKKTVNVEEIAADGTKKVTSVEKTTVESIEPPQTVVPGSATQFTSFPEGKEDKDGNTVWRVVLFKSCKDKFVSLARQNKFIVRDFNFSPAKFDELNKTRADLAQESAKSFVTLEDFSKKAWSDVFVAWLHVKAMRAFVESTLRYGTASKEAFAGLILCPKTGGNQVALRNTLANVMGTAGAGAGTNATDADGEEFFPYVSLSFAPRSVVSQ